MKSSLSLLSHRVACPRPSPIGQLLVTKDYFDKDFKPLRLCNSWVSQTFSEPSTFGAALAFYRTLSIGQKSVQLMTTGGYFPFKKEGWREKQRQRSSRLFEGRHLFSSLPR